METTDILLRLLRSAVCNETPSEDIINVCTPEVLAEVYTLAHRHDLAHLAAYALERVPIPDCEALSRLKVAKSRAIYRYARQDYEYERICTALEKARIPFIPLKGAVLRQYYPQAWMRTSGDIDVLVQEADLDRAIACLVSELGYENKGRAYHDVSFRTPSGVLLELHFLLTEESRILKAKRIIDTVWEYSEPMLGWLYGRQLTPEMLYFHHILHMGYHFYSGGCGIRFFLDHYMIVRKLQFNQTQFHLLLEESGLTRFYEAVDALSQVWFSTGEHTKRTQDLERFILSGGTFGSLSNHTAIKQVTQGGKIQSILSKIILPYDLLKGLYPVLQKKKWLTPVYQVIRWFRLLSPEKGNRSVIFLKSSINTGTEHLESIRALMQDLELH